MFAKTIKRAPEIIFDGHGPGKTSLFAGTPSSLPLLLGDNAEDMWAISR
jgi:hypothetical protein